MMGILKYSGPRARLPSDCLNQAESLYESRQVCKLGQVVLVVGPVELCGNAERCPQLHRAPVQLAASRAGSSVDTSCCGSLARDSALK